jgi:hypothetical protein
MGKNLLSTVEKIDLVKWYLEAKDDGNLKNNEEKIVVNQSNYQNIIENYFVPELRNKVGSNFDKQIFM